MHGFSRAKIVLQKYHCSHHGGAEAPLPKETTLFLIYYFLDCNLVLIQFETFA